MTNIVPVPAPAPLPEVRTRTWLGPLMVLGGGIALGFAPIGLRLGLGELGPQAIAFWRYLFAVPLLFLLVVLVDRRLPRKPNGAVFLAALFFTLDMTLWHWSLTMTSVSNATFIVNLGNVLVGLAAWAFLKERPGLNWAMAAVLAILGAAALSLGGHTLKAGALHGDLFALAAAVFVSFYMLFSKLARRTLGGLEAMFWLSVFETGLAFFVVWASGEKFMPATLAGFAAPLALALIVQVAGQGLIISGLGSTDTAVAGILVLAQPVVAAAISWRVFHEPLTAIQLGGGAAILLAVWMAQRRKGRPTGLV